MKKNKKIKTIAIFSGYSLPHLGGIERFVDNLSKKFIENGYKTIIVSSNYNNSFETITKSNNLIDMRIPIYKLFSKRYPIIKHNKKLIEVKRELDSNDISAIIVNTRFHLTSLFGAKYGRKHKIPVYLIEHGSSHLSINNKFLDFLGAIYEHVLTSYLKKFVNYYYGVSQDACDWQKHFKINSDGIWYNSINRFDENIKIEKSSENIIILYAGRILKQKGVEDLIEAFLQVKNNYKNSELIIAGDGDFLPILRKKYCDKRIKFMGKINFDELKKLYSKSNIFVHPSHYPEGLPTSILEAGLMKCAIIATPNGGTSYFINDTNGIIIKSMDDLVKALEKCLENPDYCRKIGENMQKTVINNFTWDKTVKKIINDINQNSN